MITFIIYNPKSPAMNAGSAMNSRLTGNSISEIPLQIKPPIIGKLQINEICDIWMIMFMKRKATEITNAVKRTPEPRHTRIAPMARRIKKSTLTNIITILKILSPNIINPKTARIIAIIGYAIRNPIPISVFLPIVIISA